MGTGPITQTNSTSLQIASGSTTTAYPNNVNVSGTAITNLNSTTVPTSASFGNLSLAAGSTLNVTGTGINPAYTTAVSSISSTGWTLTHNAQTGYGTVNATVSGTTATITTKSANESTQAWYNTKVNTAGNWLASFVYTNSTGGTAGDGITFTLQDVGTTAGGGNAAGLGYATVSTVSGIATSFAMGINISTGPGFAFSTNGAAFGTFGEGSVTTTTTTAITITLSYNLATTTLTLTATQGSNTYTTTDVVNIPNIVGSSAYVGFTGGTGSSSSTEAKQTVGSFSFAYQPSYAAADYASMTYGATALAGTDAISVASNSFGPSILTLGPLNDSGQLQRSTLARDRARAARSTSPVPQPA